MMNTFESQECYIHMLNNATQVMFKCSFERSFYISFMRCILLIFSYRRFVLCFCSFKLWQTGYLRDMNKDSVQLNANAVEMQFTEPKNCHQFPNTEQPDWRFSQRIHFMRKLISKALMYFKWSNSIIIWSVSIFAVDFCVNSRVNFPFFICFHFYQFNKCITNNVRLCVHFLCTHKGFHFVNCFSDCCCCCA